MIDIFKGLIDIILKSLHDLFFTEIPIYNDHNVYLGMIILTIAFIVICIIAFCYVTGIRIGDDD